MRGTNVKTSKSNFSLRCHGYCAPTNRQTTAVPTDRLNIYLASIAVYRVNI